MEERLLRAFAGLINRLRQEGLGIEGYVWRTRDDASVRPTHATNAGQVFRWDTPPNTGHPGHDYNCRCVAQPIWPGREGDVVLAGSAVTADSIPRGGAARSVGGLIARSPEGAALLGALQASNRLRGFTAAANNREVREAARKLAADLTTVEGQTAALAYAWGYAVAGRGWVTDDQETGARQTVIAEAFGLYEMYRPGTFNGPGVDIAAATATWQRFVPQVLEALEDGRLRVVEDTLSQGWVEVFPELTEDERRLGDLPSFTPERLEEIRESYAPEDLGLPTHTGTPVEDDPFDPILSTPIPVEEGPNIVTMDNPHSIETVSIPDDRAGHILIGDATGGGHRYGTGKAGKTEFPRDWTDQEILDAILDVAANGRADRPARRPNELVIVGEVRGVVIEAVVKPNGEVRTAWPKSGPGVRTNPR